MMELGGARVKKQNHRKTKNKITKRQNYKR